MYATSMHDSYPVGKRSVPTKDLLGKKNYGMGIMDFLTNL